MSLSPFSAPTPPATHTLSLHDALPICKRYSRFNPALTVNYNWTDDLSTYAKVVTGYKAGGASESSAIGQFHHTFSPEEDRKSTRLNSSHVAISYAVFCLKKKKHTREPT